MQRRTKASALGSSLCDAGHKSHEESSRGWKVTDNTENQERDRLLATEVTERSLKAVGALGIGLGGRLAFGYWTRVEASTPGQRRTSRRKPHSLNTSQRGERFRDIRQESWAVL